MYRATEDAATPGTWDTIMARQVLHPRLAPKPFRGFGTFVRDKLLGVIRYIENFPQVLPLLGSIALF